MTKAELHKALLDCHALHAAISQHYAAINNGNTFYVVAADNHRQDAYNCFAEADDLPDDVPTTDIPVPTN